MTEDERVRAAAAKAAAARRAASWRRPEPVAEPPAFTIEQAERIATVLNHHKVDYVLIGGFAALVQGAPIPLTRDLDITPDRTVLNIRRLAAALVELGARLRTLGGPADGVEIQLDEHTFDHMITMTFITDHGPLDIGFRPDGTTGYEDLIDDAVTVDIGSSRAAVASIADIIRSKTAAGRAKDLAVLADLTLYLDARRAEHDPPPGK